MPPEPIGSPLSFNVLALVISTSVPDAIVAPLIASTVPLIVSISAPLPKLATSRDR
jgi:hypothetical protein